MLNPMLGEKGFPILAGRNRKKRSHGRKDGKGPSRRGNSAEPRLGREATAQHDSRGAEKARPNRIRSTSNSSATSATFALSSSSFINTHHAHPTLALTDEQQLKIETGLAEKLLEETDPFTLSLLQESYQQWEKVTGE